MMRRLSGRETELEEETFGWWGPAEGGNEDVCAVLDWKSLDLGW